MTAKHLLDQIVRGLDGVTAGPERIWITNETNWISFSRYGASSLEHEDCPEYVRADLFRDLEERLAKAAEALEPFADQAEFWSEQVSNATPLLEKDSLTVGDVRRASATLSTIRSQK